MKALLQRVSQAQVSVHGKKIGAIDRGLLLFLGVEKQDTQAIAERLLDRVLRYRVFPDEQDKMNLNVSDVQGGLLVVSQFTLVADTTKGLRPSFSSAAPPSHGEALYRHFVVEAEKRHGVVATGQFGANMAVSLVNDGPATFLLENVAS